MWTLLLLLSLSRCPRCAHMPVESHASRVKAASAPSALGFTLSRSQFLKCLCLEALRWLQTFCHSPSLNPGWPVTALTTERPGSVAMLVLIPAFQLSEVSAPSLLTLLVLKSLCKKSDDAAGETGRGTLRGHREGEGPASRCPHQSTWHVTEAVGPAAWKPGEDQGMPPGHTTWSTIPWLGPA